MATPKRWLPFLIALPLAVLFAALGAWQLQRLSERRASNDALASRLEQPFLALPPADGRGYPETHDIVGRRVRVEGRWAPEGELVVRGQAWLGTPGVTVLTPLLTDSAHAILVLRGWLPAADGLAADLPGAAIPAPGGPAWIEGLALEGRSPSGLPVRDAVYPDQVRPALGNVDLAAADSLLPWEVASFYVQLLPDSGDGPSPPAGSPRPLPPPPLTDGPHALYAFQWFGFAAIALAGAFLLPRAAQRSAVPPEPDVAPGQTGDES